MTEKYENVELIEEEVKILQYMEEKLGVVIPKIDKIAWDDYKIDKNTHLVEKFRQHQFGFVAKNNHVIELGLSYNSINERKIKILQFMPKLSVFKNLKSLDINGWEKVFEARLSEEKKRYENYLETTRKMYRTVEERREAQAKAQRDKYQPISGLTFHDVWLQIKDFSELEYLDVSQCLLEGAKFGKILTNLKYLDLSYNNIVNFKTESESMEKLEILIVNNNPLDVFPEELTKAINLKKLNLSETNIKEIPEFVGDLKYLEELELPLQIKGFPQSIIHLKNLKALVSNLLPDHIKELPNLRSLIISSCKDEKLSDSLTELTSLKELVINNCRSLISLPKNIGNLQNLESLIITGNLALESLPESFFNLSNLRTLNLHNNNLKKFPDKLEKLPILEILTLSNNKLEHLPYSVFKLTNLIDFAIENNPLELNDKLISGKTLPEIKEYAKKKMAINIFISHAVADYEPCRLNELGQFLENQLEVDIAYLCERDLSGNIDGFMDKNIPNSQIVLFIGTANSVNSVDCQYELKLSREYNLQIIPVKAKELDWGDLAKIGLARELGIECDFKNKEGFMNFCEDLYSYIKKLKRQIDLHDKEQGKIDRLTIGLKLAERKIESLEKNFEDLNSRINTLENK
ncbi:MAG: hypothetical protein JXA99_07490 [Candidatus Lokiarchaeota archaeon]|nr:hypothetical protein [Candidatus Lokiarchaeota archaeon]